MRFWQITVPGFFHTIVRASAVICTVILLLPAASPCGPLAFCDLVGKDSKNSPHTAPEALLAPADKQERRGSATGNLFKSRNRPPFTNSLGMKFVYIPAGNFIMGSPSDEKGRDRDEALHSVTLTRGFFMQSTEVSVGQWRVFFLDTGFRTDAEKKGTTYIRDRSGWKKRDGINWNNPGYPSSDNHPVTCISWNDAQAFIRWLNRGEKRRYRLPTEAQWEYAARAGTRTARFWGETLENACAYANVHDATSKRGSRAGSWPAHPCDDGYGPPAQVGALKPNNFGLYDMMGNVWEWCLDWYGPYLRGNAVDPAGPAGGAGRVIRGGGWDGSPVNIRSALRERAWPERQSNDLGFRLSLADD